MNIKKGGLFAARILLAFIYLWVVADRVGILGPAGNNGVVWGNFENFLDYTATLNSWAPRALSDVLGYVATLIEVVLAILLIVGVRLKEVSLASLGLLIIFILSMGIFVGVNESLDFIIFTLVLGIVSGFIYWGYKDTTSLTVQKSTAQKAP